MSTPAGQRNRKILIERAEAKTDTYGGEAKDWLVHCQAWARVSFGTGVERRQAAAEGATQSATFRVPSNSAARGVTERDRIQFDGRAWDIKSTSPIGVNDEIEFVAIVAKD